MKALKNIILMFAMLMLVVPVMANGPDSLFYKANEEYNKEMYADAAEDYLKVIAAGYESGTLYYNLGNAYFKLDDIPSAILYYEKAKKLNPYDEDLDFNLNVAKMKVLDKIEPLPELFFKTWWRDLVNLFRADSWTEISLALFVLFFVLLSLYLLSGFTRIRKLSFYTGLIVLVMSVFTFVLASQKFTMEKNLKEAIVFAPTITVKSSPNENSVDLFVIHEGSKVQVIDKVGEWYKIRIANGSIGWLPLETVKAI
ncbi:MAG: tetratricopeptide repeat protein [Chlorobi bacterium]|nr:tetratricopeptide repeat protein [Chlorobiota bacterium]